MEIKDQRPEWLKNMAEKTWNLELIISGAATYMSSHLSGIVDDGFYFFLDNLNMEQDISKSSLPMLAYCFAKIVAWVLPLTFLSHFIMRAFWAGLVGLHTVFPEGIKYDQLPGYRGRAKLVFEKNFGTLAGYISRLDRKCNQMFAFAFTVVLFAIGLATIYLIMFAFTNLVPLFLNERWRSIVLLSINILVIVLAIALGISQQILKRMDPEKMPRLAIIVSNIIASVPNIMMPFVYRPMNYMTMTFSSNINRRKFYTRMTIIGIAIFSVFTLVFANMLLHIKGRNPFVFQNFFGKNHNEYSYRANQYDAQLTENIRPAAVTISDEVVEGPFLKVFVAYPKSWDQTLQQLCKLPDLPEKIDNATKRYMLDSLRIVCVSGAVQLQVNDSIVKSPDWQFARHPVGEHPGIQAMLPTKGFKEGKNTLTVKFPSAEKTDSLMVIDKVPFWFSSGK